jgi:ferredoxin-NADP reductase
MPVPRKMRCEVSKLIDHGEHVHSIFLTPEKRLPRFLPGQFLHLALDPYDPSSFWPESRVFSIASSPTDRQCVRITYAVKGKFTTRMENELIVGKEVWVKLPYGEFVINNSGDVVLFAGGTGITAFYAYLDQLETDHANSISVFYGARNFDLLIYRSMIDHKAVNCPELNAWYYSEDGHAQEDHEIIGRLSVKSAFERLNKPLEKEYYLSGPPDMLQALREDLIQRCISPDFIKIDSWE